MSARARAVLFLGKADDVHTGKAAEFCRRNFSEVEVHVGNWGEPLPDPVRAWTGDCIISHFQ